MTQEGTHGGRSRLGDRAVLRGVQVSHPPTHWTPERQQDGCLSSGACGPKASTRSITRMQHVSCDMGANVWVLGEFQGPSLSWGVGVGGRAPADPKGEPSELFSEKEHWGICSPDVIFKSEIKFID